MLPDHLADTVEPTVAAILNALNDIGQERLSQIEKWGIQHHDRDRWSTILTEEFLEVIQEVNDGGSQENLRAELIQVAAVAAAWVECLDAAA